MTINLVQGSGSVHHSQVEWDTLSTIISHFAYFEGNKLSIVSTVFRDPIELQDELSRVAAYLKQVTDDQRQLIRQVLTRVPEDDSLDRYVSHLQKSGQLNFSELNKVALLLESSIFLQEEFGKLNLTEFQALGAENFAIVKRSVLKEFRHLVDTDGELHLERHPELADLNRRLRELEDRIRRTVQEWMNEPTHQKVLQFNSYDIHFDRYVVPIRSDSYRSELGLIVSRSETGSTLFVEPYAVREACSRRLELIAKIDEIINQLSLKFSQAFAQHAELLEKILRTLKRLDFFLAKADFAQKYRLEIPVIREKPGFRFTGLFHPLLKSPVKNDAECSEGQHGIVISGPNTGGKTVFLKSLALSYLLFYHGHFVPAREAELYPYEGLFYFGDDLQDLKSGLSSFSGEVKNYLELLENILPTNLILIDEIFNSTSSDEASALSLAYFDELHKRASCHLIVSTHHQMFKTLVHQNHQYISCHVGFDTIEMKPTYKIIWGTPGSSMAIDVFRILSRGEKAMQNIPEKALEQLSQKNISYETLLQRVTQKQIELDKLFQQNQQKEIELKNQKGAMEGILNLKMQEELSRARKEIDRILDEARNLLEEARRNEGLKTKKIIEKQHDLRSELGKLAGNTPSQESIVPTGDLSLEEIRPGDIVHSLVLKKDFTVQTVDIRKREVLISKGPIKISVPVSTLIKAKSSGRKNTVSVSIQKSRNAQLELDVRGMRLEECQSVISKALGDLMAGDVPYLSVVHGHGDGILKGWLRDFLKKSPDFQGQLPENGNDGETKITLKL